MISHFSAKLKSGNENTDFVNLNWSKGKLQQNMFGSLFWFCLFFSLEFSRVNTTDKWVPNAKSDSS